MTDVKQSVVELAEQIPFVILKDHALAIQPEHVLLLKELVALFMMDVTLRIAEAVLRDIVVPLKGLAFKILSALLLPHVLQDN